MNLCVRLDFLWCFCVHVFIHLSCSAACLLTIWQAGTWTISPALSGYARLCCLSSVPSLLHFRHHAELLGCGLLKPSSLNTAFFLLNCFCWSVHWFITILFNPKNYFLSGKLHKKCRPTKVCKYPNKSTNISKSFKNAIDKNFMHCVVFCIKQGHMFKVLNKSNN